MDNMLDMMEKYANNLEEIVEHRTSELVDEKKKTDSLLYRMLPRYALQLKATSCYSVCVTLLRPIDTHKSRIILSISFYTTLENYQILTKTDKPPY